MGKVEELLQIKDTSQEYVNKNSAYVFSIKELAEYFGMSENAVYASRGHHKSQKKKKEQAKKQGKRFITDKLDKLLAFEKMREAIEEDEKNTMAIAGDKIGVLNGLENILKENKKYEIQYKEI